MSYSAKDYVGKALSGALNKKDIYDSTDNPLNGGSTKFQANMNKHLRSQMPDSNRLGGGREFKQLVRGYNDLAFAGKHKEAVEFVKNAATRLGVDFKLLKEQLDSAMANKKSFSQLMERIDHVAPTDIANITYTRKVDLHDHPVAPESQFSGGLPSEHSITNVVDHILDGETKANLEARYGPNWRLMATDIVAHLAKLQPNHRPSVSESVAESMGGVALLTEADNYAMGVTPAMAHAVYRATWRSTGSHEHAANAVKPLMNETGGSRWEESKQRFKDRCEHETIEGSLKEDLTLPF